MQQQQQQPCCTPFADRVLSVCGLDHHELHTSLQGWYSRHEATARARARSNETGALS